MYQTAILLSILAVSIAILVGVAITIRKLDYIIRNFGLIMRSQ